MQTRLVVNRSLDGKFQKITESLEEFGQVYANKFANQLVVNSPVDTGAYMEGFYSGTPSSPTSSHGRKKNQSWQSYANDAIKRLSDGVGEMRGSTEMVFGNSAEHAEQVEYEHGWRPFGMAREAHSSIARQAWEEVKRQ